MAIVDDPGFEPIAGIWAGSEDGNARRLGGLHDPTPPHGKPMADELKNLSPGRTAAFSGIIWIAKRWTIVRKVIDQPTDGTVVFELGSMQQKYEL